ncbi:MAG: radical SAM protein [Bacilli bacterium]
MLKEVKIELTNLCHRFCQHCSNNATKYLDNCIELPYEKIVKIIKEIADMKAQSIVLTGGEPTLYNNLKRVVEHIKTNYDLKVKLYTMCYRTDENIKLLTELSALGLDEIIYSTAINLSQSDDISSYNLSEYIYQLSRAINSKLSFHHVITTDTISNLKETCQLMHENTYSKNRGSMSLLRYIPHGRGTLELDLSKEELINLRNDIKKLSAQYPDFIRQGSPFNILGINHSPCIAGDEVMIIGYDGRVYPCDAMKYIDLVGFGGNIYNTSLKDIYASFYFQKVRNLKLSHHAECLICDNFSICRSGCLGQKIVRSFSPGKVRTFKEYQVAARRTMVDFPSLIHMRRNGREGLYGETGEFVDALKKMEHHKINNLITDYIEAVNYIMTTEHEKVRLKCIEAIKNIDFEGNENHDQIVFDVINKTIISAYGNEGPYYVNLIIDRINNQQTKRIKALKEIFADEIGDACWYLAASLSASYNITLNEVGEYLITNRTLTTPKTITTDILEYCQLLKDPNCLYREKETVDWPLTILDDLGTEKYGHLDFFTDDWEIIPALVSSFLGAPSRETVIAKTGELLLVLSAACHQLVGGSIIDVINQNITKLKKARFPVGFDSSVARHRVSSEQEYVNREPEKVTHHNEELIYGKTRKYYL